MASILHWFAFVSLSATLACAQSSVATGEVHGTVTDPSDALVPAATVTVENPITGFTRMTVTDGTGEYRVVSLPPGEYQTNHRSR